nr:MAG TPA: hypothetical protein [Caudoviricetes sp.]
MQGCHRDLLCRKNQLPRCRGIYRLVSPAAPFML